MAVELAFIVDLYVKRQLAAVAPALLALTTLRFSFPEPTFGGSMGIKLTVRFPPEHRGVALKLPRAKPQRIRQGITDGIPTNNHPRL